MIVCTHCGIEIPEPWTKVAAAILPPGLGRRDFCGYRCMLANIMAMLPDETIQAAYWKAMSRKGERVDTVIDDAPIDQQIIETLKFYASPLSWKWQDANQVVTEHGIEHGEPFQDIDQDQGDEARKVLDLLGIPWIE